MAKVVDCDGDRDGDGIGDGDDDGDDAGGWRFGELNASTMVSLKEEKTRLEAQLAGIPKMEKRLKELCSLLGDSSVVSELNDDEGGDRE